MATFDAPAGTPTTYYQFDSFLGNDPFTVPVSFTDNDFGNDEFDTTESLSSTFNGFSGPASSYLGTFLSGGVEYPVIDTGTTVYVIGIQLDSATYPTLTSLGLARIIHHGRLAAAV